MQIPPLDISSNYPLICWERCSHTRTSSHTHHVQGKSVMCCSVCAEASCQSTVSITHASLFLFLIGRKMNNTKIWGNWILKISLAAQTIRENLAHNQQLICSFSLFFSSFCFHRPFLSCQQHNTTSFTLTVVIRTLLQRMETKWR